MTELETVYASWSKNKFVFVENYKKDIIKLISELLVKFTKPFLHEDVWRYAIGELKNAPISVCKHKRDCDYVHMSAIATNIELMANAIACFMTGDLIADHPFIPIDWIQKPEATQEEIEKLCQQYILLFLPMYLPLKKYRVITDSFEPSW